MPQVLRLLDVMGLKAYQEKFETEQVNGEILSECDEEVLKSDLEIASKLHRMRLLKVISGEWVTFELSPLSSVGTSRYSGSIIT